MKKIVATLLSLLLSSGLAFAQAPPSAAAAGGGAAMQDSDGDGVPDSQDDCPYTVPGARVDAHGCALDEDYDGVPDGIDRCPGTPLNAEVDNEGCSAEQRKHLSDYPSLPSPPPRPVAATPAPQAWPKLTQAAPAAEPAAPATPSPRGTTQRLPDTLASPTQAPSLPGTGQFGGGVPLMPPAPAIPAAAPAAAAPVPQPEPAPVAAEPEPQILLDQQPAPATPPESVPVAPPEPQQQPAPAMVPAGMTPPEPYKLAFARGSSAITDSERSALSGLAPGLQAALAQNKRARVEVVSYTDTAGEGAHAADVGDSRAWAVHDALRSLGLPAEKLRVVIPSLNTIHPEQAGSVVVRLESD